MLQGTAKAPPAPSVQAAAFSLLSFIWTMKEQIQKLSSYSKSVSEIKMFPKAKKEPTDTHSRAERVGPHFVFPEQSVWEKPAA